MRECEYRLVNKRQAATLKILCKALAVCVPVAIFLRFCVFDIPSDEELIKKFNHDRQYLDRIVELTANCPQLIRIAPTFIRLNNGQNFHFAASNVITQEEWNNFNTLFRNCDLSTGIDIEPGYVFFPVYSKGMGNGNGVEKGFVYVGLGTPTPLLKSLNMEGVGEFTRKHPTQNIPLFSALDGKWYLYVGR
jgi:hypothetical protein